MLLTVSSPLHSTKRNLDRSTQPSTIEPPYMNNMKSKQGNQTMMTTPRPRRCRTSLLPSRAAAVAAMLLIATCSQIHSISAIDDNFDNNNSIEENPLLSSGGRRRLAVRRGGRGGRVTSRQRRLSQAQVDDEDGDEQKLQPAEEAEIINPSESSSENVEDIITDLLGNYQMTNEMKGSIMKPKLKNHIKDERRDESTQKREPFPLQSDVSNVDDESIIIRNEVPKRKDGLRLENKNRKVKSIKSSKKSNGPEKKAKTKTTTKEEDDDTLLTVASGGYRMEPFTNDFDSETKKNSRKTIVKKKVKSKDDDEDDMAPVHDEYDEDDDRDNTKKKISVIRKSSTYNGDYVPVGTVDISYYPDIGTAAYVLNVDGLDPECSSGSGGSDKLKRSGSTNNNSKNNREYEVDNDAHCLCGYCTDCTALTDPTEIANCNTPDSCMFVGHGFARPHSLYLKLDPPDQYLNQISVFFKQGKSKKKKKKSSNKGSTSNIDDTAEELECNNIIVNRDENTGLFLIEKPEGCQDDKKPGIGTQVSIDYDGDGEVDVSIHASCSVPLYAGMAIPDTPFVIEGYCLGKEEDNGGKCTHLDDQPSESVCSVGGPEKEKDTYSPTMTFMPTTYYPTTSLSPSTAEPTGSPTALPTSTPSTAEPTGRPTVTPTTGSPTALPTSTPSTAEPTGKPTVTPTTGSPTSLPTTPPTTAEPTEEPTPSPTTSSPTTPPIRVVLTQLPTPPPTSSPTATIPIRTPIPIQTPLSGMTQSDNRNRDDNLLFDPTSKLVTYTSDDCGPRGKDAYFNNLNECPDGFVLIGRGGTGGKDQGIVVDGCRYFSYQVFQCLSPRTTLITGRQPPVMMERPHSRGRRTLMEDDHRGVGTSSVPSRTLSVGVESHVPFSYFDPADSLVGYISDNCGPRGAYALADLEQCEPAGHEKVEWVPWQDGKPMVNVEGCLYFSFEVYECLPTPRVDILDDRSDYRDVIALVGPDDVTDEEYIESDMSCAVAVAEGSCDEGGEGIGGVFMGTTSDATFLVEDSYYNGEQLDGKVMLFHDYDGSVIGCGTIRPII